MNHLSGLDASFLYLETPETPMHVGGLNIYELPAGYEGDFLDNLRGHNLYAVRAIDYRLRMGSRVALTGFAGFARYELRSPAHGYYAGFGAQLRNLRPGWDVNLEARYFDRIVRIKTFADEPTIVWPNEFYSMTGVALSLSRRF